MAYEITRKRACKIGTIPMTVIVDLRYVICPTRKIRVKNEENGSWYFVRVNQLNGESGWFQADKI